jgi:lipoprotein-anchoring transpeptidase ErfK/SrfK
MKLTKILLTTLMLFSAANAKSYFKAHDDMCEGIKSKQCTNDFNSVRNLQITLNRDKNIKAKLKTDGKWGDKTKEAVIAFQKHYKLSHTDGWVGTKTKIKLDKVSQKIKFPKDKKVKHVKLMNNIKYTTYSEFKKNTNLKKSFAIYQDKKLLTCANAKNTKLKIDISEQRVRLYVDGKVALCSPCTTGAKRKLEPNTGIIRNQSTPKGTFKIKEKISDKRSTIFGKMYHGKKLVYKGDRRKYHGKKAKYVGASLKNWMRLTSGGIGLHASKYVKRHPGSNGCVRLPLAVSKTIFKNVRKGTTVSIVN